MKRIVLGTRGSDLARAQTRMTAGALRASGFDGEIEERIIQTSGDRRQDIRLSEFAKGDDPVVEKGVFTKELEDALLAGEIDAAVHSLKDLPSQLADTFSLAAVLPRAPIEDVLVVRADACGFDGLPEGATIATGSVRRERIAAWKRPDLKLIDIRGNVPTRLRKLAEGEAGDATLLARAGLERLGLLDSDALRVRSGGHELAYSILPVEEFIPAAGQGAVGIETLAGSPAIDLLASINDQKTAVQIAAERHFLYLLGAGCDTPVGAHASFDKDGGLTFSAVVFDTEDPTAPPKSGRVKGAVDAPEALAAQLLEQLEIPPATHG